MTKIDDIFCFWHASQLDVARGYLDYEQLEALESRFPLNTYMGKMFWHKDEGRKISEFLSHYTQCFLILAMSFECYILVCFPTSAKKILSRTKRISFYAIVTSLSLAVCALIMGAYRNAFSSSSFVHPYTRNDYSLFRWINVRIQVFPD